MPSTPEWCRVLCYGSSEQGVSLVWHIRKDVMELVCFEGWSDFRIQRGSEGRQAGNSMSKNSRAQVHPSVWTVESGRFL